MLAPRDQAAVFGLAEVLVALGRTKDAHDAYKKVIDLDEYSKIADAAQDALRKMAEQSFKRHTPGMPRPDAVMYCLGALEKFAKMPRAEVQQIGLDIVEKNRTGRKVGTANQMGSITSLCCGLTLLRKVGKLSNDVPTNFGEFDMRMGLREANQSF